MEKKRQMLLNSWEIDKLYLRQDMKVELPENQQKILEAIKEHSLLIFHADNSFEYVLDNKLLKGKWKLLEETIALKPDGEALTQLRLIELTQDRLIIELTIKTGDSEIILIQEMIPGKRSIEDVLRKTTAPAIACQEPSFTNYLPYIPGLQKPFFLIEEAMQCAKIQERPLLMIFSRLNCENCVENLVPFSEPRIQKYINEKYTVALLYLDAIETLPSDEKLGVNNAIWLKTRFPQQKSEMLPFFISYNPLKDSIIDTLGFIKDDIALKRFLAEGFDALKAKE